MSLDITRFRPNVICKIVRIDDALDYLRIGWAPTNKLIDTHHGLWSVLMEWQCKCPMRVPKGISA
jgi:hypothetical protein